MAWNDPGNNSGKDDDKPSTPQQDSDNKPSKEPDNPWANANRGNRNGNRNGNRGGNNQQPPDLDEVLKQLKERLGGLFGGGKSGNRNGRGGNAGNGGKDNKGGYGGLVALLLISAVAWFVYDASYTIDTRETGVVMRFGEALNGEDQLLSEGFHLRWPRPIERVITVNSKTIYTESYKSGIITKDLSLVMVSLDVQYQKKDPYAYAFRMADPEFTLKKAVSASIRRVIGRANLDDVLTNAGGSDDVGRGAVNRKVTEELNKVMDEYQTGIEITDVNINDILPPEEVRDSFERITKAGQQSEQVVNVAERERNKIETEAEGTADGMLEAANAYGSQREFRARGEAERFRQLYVQYKLAPEVTRDRMYLETMEKVMQKSSKIIVDVQGGDSMTVLPLDQLIRQRPTATTNDNAATSNATTNTNAQGGQ